MATELSFQNCCHSCLTADFSEFLPFALYSIRRGVTWNSYKSARPMFYIQWWEMWHFHKFCQCVTALEEALNKASIFKSQLTYTFAVYKMVRVDFSESLPPARYSARGGTAWSVAAGWRGSKATQRGTATGGSGGGRLGAAAVGSAARQCVAGAGCRWGSRRPAAGSCGRSPDQAWERCTEAWCWGGCYSCTAHGCHSEVWPHYPAGLDKFEQDIILKRIPAHMNASLAAVLRKTRGVCGAQTPRTVLISGAPIRKRHSLYSSFFMYTFVV